MSAALQPKMSSHYTVSTSPFDIFTDISFMTIIVIIPSLLYLPKLGFYSDDWFTLAVFDLDNQESIGRMMMNAPLDRTRPAQALYFILLYKFFGLKPLGYHITNVLCFVGNAILFYLCLLELRFSRLLALAIPLVYIFLPHYSTERFWLATFPISFAMALYFVSLYCDLRAIGAHPWRFTWKLGSIAALLGSSLIYETALGLFLINPILVWYRHGRYQTASERLKRLFILYGANPTIVVLILVFKVIFNQRDDSTLPNGNLGFYFARIVWRTIKPIWAEGENGFNIWGFLGVDLLDRGLKLPLLAIETLVQRYIGWPQLVVTSLLGILISLYLYRVASQERGFLLNRREWVRIAVIGLVMSVAGYAIFLVAPNLWFTLAGTQNRVSISAAAGISVALVATIGWAVSNLSGEYLTRGAFASLVALFAATGCVVDLAIGSFWTAAFQREGMVLAAIRNHFPALPEGSTLILDGICPTVGPAIIFASGWDLTGALRLMYRDRSLRANVVPGLERQGDLVQKGDAINNLQNQPPKLKVTPDGIEMNTSGHPAEYPYGPGLFIYNIAQDMDIRIADQKVADDYFTSIGSNLYNCRSINEGIGVPIF
jgi:hypothetical protein